MKENQRVIIKSNFKILLPNIIVTLAFFAGSIIIAVFFPNIGSAVFISERVLVLAGVLLYPPVFLECSKSDENLHELIVSKYVKYKHIIYIRYISVSAILFTIITVYILLTIGRISTFLISITIINTLCISIFLGSIGLLFSYLAKNTVLGYMAAFGVYTAEMLCELTYSMTLIFPPIDELNVKSAIILVIAITMAILCLFRIKNTIK